MNQREPNAIDAHVGNRIRMRRQLLGVSQEKLGEILGITFQQIQKYEKGSNRISASRLYYTAKALGTPVKFFFEGLPQADDNGGFGEPGTGGDILTSLSTRDGVALAQAFSKLHNGRQRELLVAIAELMARAKS